MPPLVKLVLPDWPGNAKIMLLFGFYHECLFNQPLVLFKTLYCLNYNGAKKWSVWCHYVFVNPLPHAMSPWVTFRWSPSPLHVGDVICEQPNTESYGRNIAETLLRINFRNRPWSSIWMNFTLTILLNQFFFVFLHYGPNHVLILSNKLYYIAAGNEM